METLKKGAFRALGSINFSDEVLKTFAIEQKKEGRTHQRFAKKVKSNENNIQYEILFDAAIHPKLCGKTIRSLNYALMFDYKNKTKIKALKEYALAVCGRYQGYTRFDAIIRQKEVKLVEYLISNFSSEELKNSAESRQELRMILSALVFNSDFIFTSEILDAIDLLLVVLKYNDIKI